MGDSLQTLVNCEKLSLSTNQIERMVDLPGCKKLKILSLGRNHLKRIMGLESVGQSLEQLWLSYNMIERFDNLEPCVKLNTLYMANNCVKNW